MPRHTILAWGEAGAIAGNPSIARKTIQVRDGVHVVVHEDAPHGCPVGASPTISSIDSRTSPRHLREIAHADGIVELSRIVPWNG